MPDVHHIHPAPLTKESFAPYGQALYVSDNHPSLSGDGWQCWSSQGFLSLGQHTVGIVKLQRTNSIITAMERERSTEFLLAVDGSIIQTVALPDSLDDPHARPNAATVRAFIIQPGQGVIMAPGTWHYAALPLQETALYYYVAEPYIPPADNPGRSPWIPFLNDACIEVVY